MVGDVDRASLGLYQSLGDGETQTPTPTVAAAGRVTAEGHIEDPLDVVVGDAATFVDDREHRAMGLDVRLDDDAPPCRRGANRVVEEVVQPPGPFVFGNI